MTSPNGKWIAFTYGTRGRVSQVTDNIGRTVNYVYDTFGRLSTVTDPENNVTTYTWDSSNRIATVKDGRNIVYLTNHYDGNGRVDQQTLADPNAKYTFAYTTDVSGNITQTDITDPRSHTNRQTFQNHYLVSSWPISFGPLVRRKRQPPLARGPSSGRYGARKCHSA